MTTRRARRILQPATVLVNHKGDTIFLLTGATRATLDHLGVKRLCLDCEPTAEGDWKAVPVEEENRNNLNNRQGGEVKDE